MPEQLTKHPEVTLEVLRSAGAKCGDGTQQSILTQCPAERFCKLPGGEVCVYGLADVSRMTQISTSDWLAVQQAVQPGFHSSADSFGGEPLLVGAAGLCVGIAVGALLTRHKSKRS